MVCRVYSSLFIHTSHLRSAWDTVKTVPEKTRLEIVIGMQSEILDGHARSLLKQLIRKETLTLTIEDFDLRFDEHFEFHFLGNGLYSLSSLFHTL